MSNLDSRENYLASIEAAVGGAYRMQDGRDFWMDAAVAREVSRRAADGAGAWIRSQEPESVVAIAAERDRLCEVNAELLAALRHALRRAQDGIAADAVVLVAAIAKAEKG